MLVNYDSILARCLGWSRCRQWPTESERVSSPAPGEDDSEFTYEAPSRYLYETYIYIYVYLSFLMYLRF